MLSLARALCCACGGRDTCGPWPFQGGADAHLLLSCFLPPPLPPSLPLCLSLSLALPVYLPRSIVYVVAIFMVNPVVLETLLVTASAFILLLLLSVGSAYILPQQGIFQSSLMASTSRGCEMWLASRASRHLIWSPQGVPHHPYCSLTHLSLLPVSRLGPSRSNRYRRCCRWIHLLQELTWLEGVARCARPKWFGRDVPRLLQ